MQLRAIELVAFDLIQQRRDDHEAKRIPVCVEAVDQVVLMAVVDVGDDVIGLARSNDRVDDGDCHFGWGFR